MPILLHPLSPLKVQNSQSKRLLGTSVATVKRKPVSNRSTIFNKTRNVSPSSYKEKRKKIVKSIHSKVHFTDFLRPNSYDGRGGRKKNIISNFKSFHFAQFINSMYFSEMLPFDKVIGSMLTFITRTTYEYVHNFIFFHIVQRKGMCVTCTNVRIQKMLLQKMR